jgi:hypothetical protein
MSQLFLLEPKPSKLSNGPRAFRMTRPQVPTKNLPANHVASKNSFTNPIHLFDNASKYANDSLMVDFYPKQEDFR